MIVNFISALGKQVIDFFRALGRAGFMLFGALIGKPQIRKHFPLLVKQMHVLGVQSLLIILLSGLFIGMVLGLQGYVVLVDFSAETSLGQLVALSLLRELGPVVTALLFAGRAGSALTAEIGLMKATEQLSSLEMMAVDPLRRVIAPRFWAGVISMPILSILFIAIGIWGGSLVGVDWKGVDSGSFWSVMQNSVSWSYDILNGFIKAVFFAVAVTWIALFNGYDCMPTSEGISQATTRTVVHASLVVLGLDFILTAKYEFWVGLFLLLGIGALVFLGLRVANVQGFGETKSYTVTATFDNIGGLKVRAPLKVGGVVIGRVSGITLDEKSYLPKVSIAINQEYNEIPENSSLSIKTSGLLGEQYIALTMGFDDGESAMLKEGSQIQDTKSAMVLEDLIGQFLYGDKKSDGNSEKTEPTVQ